MVPGICTGDERLIVVFCPSRPLFPHPHDHKVPSVLVASEKLPPPFILFHEVPGICTGDERLIISLSPSCPAPA